MHVVVLPVLVCSGRASPKWLQPERQRWWRSGRQDRLFLQTHPPYPQELHSSTPQDTGGGGGGGERMVEGALGSLRTKRVLTSCKSHNFNKIFLQNLGEASRVFVLSYLTSEEWNSNKVTFKTKQLWWNLMRSLRTHPLLSTQTTRIITFSDITQTSLCL